MSGNAWRAVWLPAVCLLWLSACAMTAEQRAAYEARLERERRQTEFALAGRCDPELARLMALREEGYPGLDAGQRGQSESAYAERAAAPAFQACYRMAWENLLYRRRLEEAERRAMRRELDRMMFAPLYRYRYY